MDASESDISKRKEQRFHTVIVVDVVLGFFSREKAVLMDMSWQGFKIGFAKSVDIKEGDSMSLKIPISNYKISDKEFLVLKVIVKWYDGKGLKAGGVFIQPEGENAEILEKLIHKLSEAREAQNKANYG